MSGDMDANTTEDDEETNRRDRRGAENRGVAPLVASAYLCSSASSAMIFVSLSDRTDACRG